MKVSGFLVFLLVLVTVLMLLSFSGSSNGSLSPDIFSDHRDGGSKMTAVSRKLKENGYGPRHRNAGGGNVNLDDYQPIDPSPSSKASIKPGPIEHGTPIIPYIPKPSPPAHRYPGGSP